MFESPEFWVAIAFVLFVGIVTWKAGKTILLQKMANAISDNHLADAIAEALTDGRLPYKPMDPGQGIRAQILGRPAALHDPAAVEHVQVAEGVERARLDRLDHAALLGLRGHHDDRDEAGGFLNRVIEP